MLMDYTPEPAPEPPSGMAAVGNFTGFALAFCAAWLAVLCLIWAIVHVGHSIIAGGC